MSTAKIRKRVQIWMIFLLIITTVNGCEIDTKPRVSGGNPPIIKFNGTGVLAQLFVDGPYTLEQIKGAYKITRGSYSLTDEQEKELAKIYGNKNYSLWQLVERLISNLT